MSLIGNGTMRKKEREEVEIIINRNGDNENIA